MTSLPPSKEFTKACKEAERKPIPGYEGYYDATSDGMIISCARTIMRSNGRPLIKSEMVLKFGRTHNGDGYRTVTLSKNSVPKCFTVHSLIALTFLGPRPDGLQICHGDGDTSNNAVSNLRYDTAAGNSLDKIAHGTYQIGEKSSNSKLTTSQVLEIREQLKLGRKQREIASDFSISKSLVWAINAGKVWSHV